MTIIEAYLHPLAVTEHLHFERWICEGEVCIDPAVLRLMP